MKLSSATKQKLDNWANCSTWSSNHDLDMNRFYEFVDQYATDHGNTINESDLIDEIANITNTPTHPDNPNLETIRSRVSLAYNILDFLNASGR